MNKLYFFLSLIILSSCSVKKEEYYWVTEKIVVKDSILVSGMHEHYCDSAGCVCFYIEPRVITYTDTLFVEFLKKKERRKTRCD